MPNGAVTQAGKAVAGEVLVGEVADGLFFAARQDHFAEVLVRLLDALGRPTLVVIPSMDGSTTEMLDSRMNRQPRPKEFFGAHRQCGCIPTAGIRPALQRGFADGRTGQIFGESNCFIGTLFIDPRPLSQSQSFYFDPKTGGIHPWGR